MGWNHTWPHHKTSTLQINEMSTPLESGHNSSYQAVSDAPDIIQSRRTSGKAGRHLMRAQTFIYYLLLQSKDKGNEDDSAIIGQNRWSTQTWLNCSKLSLGKTEIHFGPSGGGICHTHCGHSLIFSLLPKKHFGLIVNKIRICQISYCIFLFVCFLICLMNINVMNVFTLSLFFLFIYKFSYSLFFSR